MSHANWIVSLVAWHYLVETTYWPHQYRPISAERTVLSSIINSCCLTSLILKKVWYDDAFCPKSAPNSDRIVGAFGGFSLIARGFSELQTRQFWRLTKPSIIYFARKTSIHFLMINNPFHIVVSCNAPFLLTLNSQLSNCSFFTVANNLMQKWRQIQILR